MNLDTLLDSQDYEITGETKDKACSSPQPAGIPTEAFT